LHFEQRSLLGSVRFGGEVRTAKDTTSTASYYSI